MSEREPAARRLTRMRILFHALRELGPPALFQFALYRIGLISGHLRRQTRSPKSGEMLGDNPVPKCIYSPPEREWLREILGEDGLQEALRPAELAASGRMRLFGGAVVEIRLKPPEPRRHWTEYELGRAVVNQDVKFIWEPARLGWAIELARGYVLSGEERYAAAFWELLEDFLEANPAYLGLNWVSGQEAGLRLLAMSFAWSVFACSPHSTQPRAARLAQAIAVHAGRIPPALAYARAQNNNHLLSEAAGLYTAGLAIPDHPQAHRWRKTGWNWLQRGLAAQIDEEGVYIQQSANYQRLMLQIALWVQRIAANAGESLPREIMERLGASTRWLSTLLDARSGRAPNLGPNDGAYLFPLTNLPYEDYRPVLQAANQAFLGIELLEKGPWDEMIAWLGAGEFEVISAESTGHSGRTKDARCAAPLRLNAPGGESWAYLRAAQFHGRPGHADQLHLDLWWRGLNVAQDAGTYRYNAPDPWENALAGSDVHNTVTVDGLDQMLRAGRFLFLERAHAEIGEKGLERDQDWERASAQHSGYRRVGVIHQRAVTCFREDVWLVEDALLPISDKATNDDEHTACLSWLIPDWAWKVVEQGGKNASGESTGCAAALSFSSPAGPVRLTIRITGPGGDPCSAGLQIVRAGESVHGSAHARPTWGWYSPTYREKSPALSVRVQLRAGLPLYFKSEWRFGNFSDED